MADDKKLPSTFANMVIVLTVIGLISALALGYTYTNTKDTIAQVETNKILNALKVVLPPFDNNPSLENYTLPGDNFKEVVFYPATKGGVPVGVAVHTYSDKGFSGRIWLMVGFTPDNKINAITVLKHGETAGLGAKMGEPKFKDQFTGKDPQVYKMTVNKDAGEVDAISAATITSRAFCDATQRAYDGLKLGRPVTAPVESPKDSTLNPVEKKSEATPVVTPVADKAKTPAQSEGGIQ